MRAILAALVLLAATGSAFAQAGNPLAGPQIVYAAKNGNVTGVRNELLRGVSPNKRDANGITGLMAAARSGHPKVVEVFVQFKARLNAHDPQRNTALHMAAERNHATVVEIILKAGGNANAIDRFGATPLMKAAKNGHLEVVETLLRHRADIEATDFSGKTALELAVEARQSHVVRRLKAAQRR